MPNYLRMSLEFPWNHDTLDLSSLSVDDLPQSAIGRPSISFYKRSKRGDQRRLTPG